MLCANAEGIETSVLTNVVELALQLVMHFYCHLTYTKRILSLEIVTITDKMLPDKV